MKKFSFNIIPFILLNTISVLLVFSWTYGATREYWDVLDKWVFDATNPLLGELGSAWSWSWALLSIRIADLISLFVILWFFYAKDVIFANKDRLFGLIGFVLLGVVMLFARELLDLYVEFSNLDRASPTALISDALRLSSMYPNFGLKDISMDSFPGDHAAVLFTWLGYCLFFVRNKWSYWIIFFVVLFSTPRLMAGAHWMSDILVGGVSTALTALAFGVYTPVLNKPQKILNKIANRIF